MACALVLLLTPLGTGGPDVAPEPEVPAPAAPAETGLGPAEREQLLTGIDQTREARRALIDGNYRDARDHLARVENSLTQLLASAGSAEHTAKP